MRFVVCRYWVWFIGFFYYIFYNKYTLSICYFGFTVPGSSVSSPTRVLCFGGGSARGMSVTTVRSAPLFWVFRG
jgi:hypothetical protein